jgi:hypothetical protein
MVTVKLYIEGGGDSHREDTEFRQAWSLFFGKAGLPRMPRIIRGGGRERTFDAYHTAVRTGGPDELPLLLVDSEDLVADGATAWAHLQAHDGWAKPDSAGDEDAYLMITCMETWFVADRETLQKFFPGLIERHLPQWHDPEKVPKPKIFSALERATGKCPKPYGKGKVSFELLGRIEPGAVEGKCAAARLILERLRDALR